VEADSGWRGLHVTREGRGGGGSDVGVLAQEEEEPAAVYLMTEKNGGHRI